eukprot:122260_1
MVTTILITVLSLLRLSQSLTLTTGFNRDNSYWGNMFDVQNRENYLQIDGFDLNLFDGTWDIEIWYKKCSYFGFHDDASAWTEIHTETVTSSGINSPTSLTPLTTPINMYPHTTYSFWIAVVSGGTVPDEYDGAMMYTDGNEECDLWICDANLQFYQGLGTNKIPNDFWKPRVWNGNIYYTIVPPFNPPNTDPCTNECTTTASIAICTVTNAPTISTNTPTILILIHLLYKLIYLLHHLLIVLMMTVRMIVKITINL